MSREGAAKFFEPRKREKRASHFQEPEAEGIAGEAPDGDDFEVFSLDIHFEDDVLSVIVAEGDVGGSDFEVKTVFLLIENWEGNSGGTFAAVLTVDLLEAEEVLLPSAHVEGGHALGRF